MEHYQLLSEKCLGIIDVSIVVQPDISHERTKKVGTGYLGRIFRKRNTRVVEPEYLVIVHVGGDHGEAD